MFDKSKLARVSARLAEANLVFPIAHHHAPVGTIHRWSDGHSYRKTLTGWEMVHEPGSNDIPGHPETEKPSPEKVAPNHPAHKVIPAPANPNPSPAEQPKAAPSDPKAASDGKTAVPAPATSNGAGGWDLKAHGAHETNLKPGDETEVRWTNNHSYYTARGAVVANNDSSVRVRLLHNIDRGHMGGYGTGREIVVPKFMNLKGRGFGVNANWSQNNGVFPITDKTPKRDDTSVGDLAAVAKGNGTTKDYPVGQHVTIHYPEREVTKPEYSRGEGDKVVKTMVTKREGGPVDRVVKKRIGDTLHFTDFHTVHLPSFGHKITKNLVGPDPVADKALVRPGEAFRGVGSDPKATHVVLDSNGISVSHHASEADAVRHARNHNAYHKDHQVHVQKLKAPDNAVPAPVQSDGKPKPPSTDAEHEYHNRVQLYLSRQGKFPSASTHGLTSLRGAELYKHAAASMPAKVTAPPANATPAATTIPTPASTGIPYKQGKDAYSGEVWDRGDTGKEEPVLRKFVPVPRQPGVPLNHTHAAFDSAGRVIKSHFTGEVAHAELKAISSARAYIKATGGTAHVAQFYAPTEAELTAHDDARKAAQAADAHIRHKAWMDTVAKGEGPGWLKSAEQLPLHVDPKPAWLPQEHHDAIVRFAQTMRDRRFAAMVKDGMTAKHHAHHDHIDVKYGRTYANVDRAGSGKHMIALKKPNGSMSHLEPGDVVGIKGYGVPHPGYRRGNVLKGTADPGHQHY